MANDIIAFLGNGFDLSLGLKTSYSHFISNCWENLSKYPEIGLKAYFSKIKKESTWFDLGKAMSDYVFNFISNPSSEDSEISEADVVFHQAIVDELGNYLSKIQRNTIQFGNPVAEEILKAIANNIIAFTFTFNYTNLSLLSSKKEISIPQNAYKHLHGDISDPILGIIDFTNGQFVIPKPYCKWIKSWHINYTPHAVTERLMNAREVIFYGLSFGAIDYIYFKDYFNAIANRNISDSKRVFVDLITKDYNSQIDIFIQLREMGIDVNTLMSKCNLNIIRLDNAGGIDTHSFENLESLKKRLTPPSFDENGYPKRI